MDMYHHEQEVRSDFVEQDYLIKQELFYMVKKPSEFPPISHINGLVLYYRPNCPYCIKVIKYLESLNISLQLRNIENSVYMNDLIRIGGKRQVPCLIANDMTAMYESKDIIEWFKNNIDLLDS